MQYEARLIRDAFYRHPHHPNRFLPVVLPGQSDEGVPDFLALATMTVYHVSEFSVAGAAPLLRLLLGRTGTAEPSPGQPNRIVPSAPLAIASVPPPADGPAWLTDRLDRLDIVLEDLDSTETVNRQAFPKVSACVRDASPPTNAVLALRLRAEPLRAAGRSNPDEPRLRTALSTLESAAARALQRARDRQRRYAEGSIVGRG